MVWRSEVESANVAAFRKIIKAFATGDESLLEGVIAPDFIEHQFGMGSRNADGVKGAIRFLHRLAPNFNFVAEELVEDGDKVWGRMTGTGTHTGPGLGEPTGRSWEITVFDVGRFRDGQLVEHWGVPDRFAQMAQLGLVPRP